MNQKQNYSWDRNSEEDILYKILDIILFLQVFWLGWLITFLLSWVIWKEFLWVDDQTWFHDVNNLVIYIISWAVWAWLYTTNIKEKIKKII